MNNKIWYIWYKSFMISAFTFGGGYVVIPMIRKYFAEDKALIEERDVVEMAAIAQSVPGAIAVNLSVLNGYRIAGYLGAFSAFTATILPPLLILGCISTSYAFVQNNVVILAVLKGMQAGVAAIMVDVVLDMVRDLRKLKSSLLLLMMILAFFATFVFSISIAITLACCIVVSCLLTTLKLRGERS